MIIADTLQLQSSATNRVAVNIYPPL